MADEQKKTICLDFDGVLHSYKSGWLGEDVLEEPMEGAQDFCRTLKVFFEVVIFSSRSRNSLGYGAMVDWLGKHNFPFMPISSVKPMAVLYVDDRGFRFTGSFGDVLHFIKENPGLPSGTCQAKETFDGEKSEPQEQTRPLPAPSSNGLKRLAQWHDRNSGCLSTEAWYDLLEVAMHMENEARNG